MDKNVKKPIRRWPALVIIGLAILGVAIVWPISPTHQARNIRTFMIVLWSGVALLLWFLFASRASLKSRILLLSVVLLGGIGARQFLVIRGVTGDLIPIIGFRFAAKPVRPQPIAQNATNAHPADPGISVSADFPQFQGLHRDGVLEGPALETNWVEHAPKVLWKQPIGAGWSGFATRGDRAVTQEQRGEKEMVVCYNLLTGAELWEHSDDAHYNTTIAGEGPRATPTISSNRVFTLGSTGVLNCLDLESGKLLWQKNVITENHASQPEWGLAGSPLVFEGKVIVSAGGANGHSLVAYSVENGDLIWGGGDAGADYSSPLEAKLVNQSQILIFNTFGLVSHDPKKGEVLWKYPWPGSHPHITLPLVVNSNSVLLSSGYGTGVSLLEISRDGQNQWKAAPVWKTLALKSKFGPILARAGYVYGFDDGIFTCVDLKTGQRKWKDGRFGHGQGLLVNNLLLITSEKGDVLLLAPNPDKLEVLSSLHLLDDKTWNPPALAGEYLLIRNDKEAACIKLPTSLENKKNIALLFANPIFDH